MTEISTPIVVALRKAGDERKEKIRKDVYEAINQKFTNGSIVIDSSALVIYGEK